MDECILPPIAQIPRHASLIRAPADLDETVRELLHGEPKPPASDKEDAAWGHFLKWTDPLEQWIPEVINLSSHFQSVPSVTEFVKNPGTPPPGMSAEEYRFNWAICRYRTLRHLAYFIDSKCAGLDSPLRELNLKSMNTGDLIAYSLPRALRKNTTIRKIDLRDNNITVAGMLRLLDCLASYSVDLDEVLFDEGDKTIVDKGRESSSPEIDHMGSVALRSGVGGEVEDTEYQKYIKQVVPRLAEVLEGNRSIRRNFEIVNGTVELNFKGRDCLARDTLANIIRRLKQPKVLIIDKLHPPKPIHLSDLDRVRDPTLRQQLTEYNFTLPEEFAMLAPSLEELRFYNMIRIDKIPDKPPSRTTLISSLPRWVGLFTGLKILTISASGLKEVDGAILGQLRNLQQLNLPLNELAILPVELGGLTNLTRLSLFGNQLHSLPHTLTQLTKLQAVLVQDNFLESTSIELLAALVQAAPGINDLKCLNQQRALTYSSAVAELMIRETAAVKNKQPSTDFLQWLKTHDVKDAFGSPEDAMLRSRAMSTDTVIRSAWFTKKGGNRRNWKKRYFVLSPKAIKYYATDDAKTPKGSIALSEIIKVDVKADDKREYLLSIVTKGRTYYIHSEDRPELEAWKAALQPIAVLQ